MITHHISPNCPAEVDAAIRIDAAKKNELVMPRLPWPWHRRRVRELMKMSNSEELQETNKIRRFFDVRS